MKRYLILAATVGLAAVVAFLAIRAATGPAEAHVVTLTVDPKGFILSPGGSQVSISGTLRCTPVHRGRLFVHVSKFVRGQVLVSASGLSPEFACSGVDQSWTVTALTVGAGLISGPANVFVNLDTCGLDGFDFEQTSAAVRLRPVRELPPIGPPSGLLPECPPPISPPISPPGSAPILLVGSSRGGDPTISVPSLERFLAGREGLMATAASALVLTMVATAGFLRLLSRGSPQGRPSEDGE